MISSKVLRKVVSTIFSFLLFLAVTGICFISGIYLGVFNDNNFLTKMNESNYYNEVYEEIVGNLSKTVQGAEVPDEIISQVFTLKDTYHHGKNYVEQTLNTGNGEIDTVDLFVNLESKIYEYLESENIEITNEVKEGVDNICQKSVKEYERILTFRLADYYKKYKTDFNRIAPTILAILIGIAIVIIAILLMLYKKKYRSVRYISYSILGAAFMMLLPAIYLLVSKEYEKIEASPEYYYVFLQKHLIDDIQVFLYIGAGAILIFSILLLSIKLLKMKHYE